MNEKQELENWAKNYAKEFNAELKEIMIENKLKVKDMIAMSAGTDPFWMTKSKVLKAKWAEKIMNEVIKPYLRKTNLRDDHLRNIHYILVGMPEMKTWSGEQYLNEEKCWDELLEGFAVARYLDFVDYRLIRDKKNDVYERTFYHEGKTFEKAMEEAKNNINAESIISDVFVYPFYRMLNEWAFQPVHIEIWLEKDLALVEKITKQYSINTVVGTGETSVSMVYELFDRITNANRPVRIAYISDCDVVGSNMVKAMSRKAEYLLRRRNLEIDIKIIPLMATPEQVKELNLPTAPMKKSESKGYETRKKNWLESRRMTGAVEVNSLHAQYPEYFEATLIKFIESYLDKKRWDRTISYR